MTLADLPMIAILIYLGLAVALVLILRRLSTGAPPDLAQDAAPGVPGPTVPDKTVPDKAAPVEVEAAP